MKHKSRPGFTIIELLVVVTIIGILTGLMLPGLRWARESARTITCVSNLRQIVMAWQIYADNNGGIACPSYYFQGGKEHAWDFVIDYSNPGGDLQYGFLGRYIREGRINNCPSFDPSTTWGRPYTGYAYNATYVGGDVGAKPPVPAAVLSKIRMPSSTVVFADAGYAKPVLPNNYLRAPSDPLFIAGKVHFCHQGGANVAYADGHVDTVRTKYRFDPTTPDVGALSEDDSAYDLE